MTAVTTIERPAPATLGRRTVPVTAMLITFNEVENIRRTVAKLDWADELLVIDSGSTDGTIEIIKSMRDARIVFRAFTDFASQCNFGLSLVRTPWVLSLDADYELSDPMIDSIRRAVRTEDAAGFRARFVYRIYGRPLRASLYPPRVVLYRQDRAKYQNEGHGHRVSIDGVVENLDGVIFHDDRKPLKRWISSQLRYAHDEAEHLAQATPQELSKVDRLRLMGWPAPILISVYVLILKQCILDGWPGWLYALQRLFAEVLLALEIVDARLRRAENIEASNLAAVDPARAAKNAAPDVAAAR
jgi:glycosyltransferase involved in cell wall biosynthesis